MPRQIRLRLSGKTNEQMKLCVSVQCKLIVFFIPSVILYFKKWYLKMKMFSKIPKYIITDYKFAN